MKRQNHFYKSFTAVILLTVSLFSTVSRATDVSANNVVKNFEQKLKTYQGQVIYIDFWASWCIPCRQSFPWMNAMQKKYQAQGFKVVTINLDTDKENALEFLQSYSAQFDVVYDPKGKLAKKFKLKGMPNSFMINRAGKIVSAHVGFNDEKSKGYEQEILTLLAEK
jgi:thiol-disulfide isomerase/thioredoxin